MLASETFKAGVYSVFMNKIFKEAKEENPLFDLPMKVPGKKMLQYVYTNRKMRKLLKF